MIGGSSCHPAKHPRHDNYSCGSHRIPATPTQPWVPPHTHPLSETVRRPVRAPTEFTYLMRRLRRCCVDCRRGSARDSLQAQPGSTRGRKVDSRRQGSTRAQSRRLHRWQAECTWRGARLRRRSAQEGDSGASEVQRTRRDALLQEWRLEARPLRAPTEFTYLMRRLRRCCVDWRRRSTRETV